VLARKPAARQAFGERGICAVVALLAAGPEDAVAAEAANALLNLCYERSNVAAVHSLPLHMTKLPTCGHGISGIGVYHGNGCATNSDSGSSCHPCQLARELYSLCDTVPEVQAWS